MADFYYSSTAQPNTLASDIDGSATSCSLSSTPAGYPVNYPFKVALDPDQPTEEIVYVTNLVGTTATITRAREGTAGQSHTTGAVFQHMMTGNDLQLSRNHEAATTDVHGIGGTASVVGTDTAQTLTNKTLDGDDNTFQNVPQSAVTDLVTDQATQDSDISTNASNISSLTTSFTNHDTSTGEHGVSEVVGRTEAQTLTNKTIDSDDNALDIGLGALRRAVLNLEGNGTDFNVGDNNSRMRTTFSLTTNVGGFTAGANSAEWIVPYTGLYLVTHGGRVTGASGSTEEFELRVYVGGTPGNIDGSLVTRFGGNMNTAGTPEGYANGAEVLGVLSAGERVKFVIFNDTGATISDDGNGDFKHAGLIYLGPAS